MIKSCKEQLVHEGLTPAYSVSITKVELLQNKKVLLLFLEVHSFKTVRLQIFYYKLNKYKYVTFINISTNFKYLNKLLD